MEKTKIMGFTSRLKNSWKGFTGEAVVPRDYRKNVPSMPLAELSNFMEISPGLSQPVWGPEISTVGAYSREGYTSKTFDTPAIPFRTQKIGLQVDEDTQLAINHLSSQVTGGAHYVKAEKTFVVDYFKKFTKDLQFDTLDTELVK